MVFSKTFDELTNHELLEIEQQIYVVDIDEFDVTAQHVFIKRGGHIVSYARLIKHHDQLYVGRLATKKTFRGQGFATEIMQYFQEKHEFLAVSAQIPVIPFYKGLGFKMVGKKYKEAGLDHQKMVFIK